MSSITPKALVAGNTIGNTTEVLYTAPPATRAVINAAVITNYGPAAVTVTLWITPTNTTPTADDLVAEDYPLAAGQTWTATPLLGQVLNTANTLQAVCSVAGSATIRVSGLEVV